MSAFGGKADMTRMSAFDQKRTLQVALDAGYEEMKGRKKRPPPEDSTVAGTATEKHLWAILTVVSSGMS